MKKKQELSSIEKKIAKDEVNLAEDAQVLSVIAGDIKKVTKILRSSGFSDFLRYLKSPWKIIWINFLAGIFRGLGMIIGMTVVFALVIWTLSKFVDYPLIGEYVKNVQDNLEEYTEQTNYKVNFEQIEELLFKNNVYLKKTLNLE